jgi:hypothetical protein
LAVIFASAAEVRHLQTANLHVLTPGQMFTFWAETHEAQVSVFTQL